MDALIERRSDRKTRGGSLADACAAQLWAAACDDARDAVAATDCRTLFHEAICAVDFSPGSIAALHAACALVGAAGGGRVTLLHALDAWPRRMPLSAAGALRDLHQYESRAAAESQRLLGLVSAGERDRCRIETLVVSGVPHQMILRAASEARADLIAMGTALRGPGDDVSCGPTARAVLRRARCPVLLAGHPASSAERRLGMLPATGHTRADAGAPLGSKAAIGSEPAPLPLGR